MYRTARQDVPRGRADGARIHDEEGPGEEGRPGLGQGAHVLLTAVTRRQGRRGCTQYCAWP